MDLQLKDKVALITGSTKGIGRKVADMLAAEGCHLGICARDRDEVTGAVEALSASGVKVHGDVVDVADKNAYEKWFADCADALGGIDIFIPNVSYGGFDPSETGWQRNFELDMMGTWRGVEAALPYLEKSSSASMVFISSTAAIEAFAGAPSYGAMKAAILNYAGNLAINLAPSGIRVNSVSPGPIFIEGGAWDQIQKDAPEVYDATRAAIAMERLGRAEEVASQIVLLASPLAGFTTGTNVVIDGGFTRRVQF